MTPLRYRKIPSASMSSAPRVGFTLIELMVVLIIVGLLAAVAIPSYIHSMADSRLESSASRLLMDIKRAKLEASRSRSRYFVYFPSATGQTWSIYAGPDASMAWSFAKLGNKLKLLSRDSLETGVSFLQNTAPPALNVAGSGVTTPISGPFDNPVAGTDDCSDGVAYPSAAPTTGWPLGSSEGLIVACGGAISDLSVGVLYLTSKSTSKAFAISYNHLGGLSNQVRMFQYDGSNWREVQ